ncbi:MAG: hypothetical protein GC136_11125 [Alphaproteobacteria bacterium]|nr:hypothetical protein [Alphaproteobacteria bacterium]
MAINRALILNGPSSVGKTSIGLALRKTLPGNFHLIQWDTFLEMPPLTPPSPTLKYAFLDAAHSLLQQEHNVILDIVSREEFLQTICGRLTDFAPYLVGISARPDIIAARLATRPERVPTLLAEQADLHNGIKYDLEIDTSDTDISLSTDKIANAFKLIL